MFGCAGCGAVLTAAVSQVALPVHARDTHWEELHPALLEAGTYAVDPEPHGPPWRLGETVGAEEAAARGLFAPVRAVSDGPPGTVLLAPGDMRGTGLIAERTEGYCLGINSGHGPNLACLGCGLPVGGRDDDCGHWQVVRLLPQAVVRLPGPPERPVLDWAQLPVEGAPWQGLNGYEDIPAGAALAHVVAASGGRPVGVPPGPVAELLGWGVAALLPAREGASRPGTHGPGSAGSALRPEARGPSRGDGALRMDVGGPGAGEPDAELLLVPIHPQTGEVWQPRGGAVALPVEAALWAAMALPRERTRLPVVGGLPVGEERDDPLPPHPSVPFRPSLQAFRHTLARMPAVREPWLRALYDRGW
ncbi:hypothetical protein [Streptomyces sp. NPDC021020]|uniref:hypothetical protein n=1 Tax=Streptomyces sp. NPDC021020 TaxID=3365109 RepID=UPI003790806A